MFVKVKNDLEEGKGKVIDVNGKSIALFKKDGNFYALENSCKHAGGPLGEGELDGNLVSCPWHQWKYDIKTGSCKTVNGVKQEKFNVKVEGENVFVEILD